MIYVGLCVLCRCLFLHMLESVLNHPAIGITLREMQWSPRFEAFT